MTDPTPYTIVGAGAIGGTLAVHLDAAGVPVQLVDADPEHVAAIRTDGLRLRTSQGERVARLPIWHLDDADAPATLGPVLLAVKALATDAAAAWIAPRLAPDGWVASLQNGLNEATIARHVGADRTVIAFVDLFADVVGPGIVQDGGLGAMALGEYAGGTSDRNRALAADLHQWGTPVVTDNVAGFLWSKLAFGAMLTATALADDAMSVLIDRNRDVMAALAREVLAVTEAQGITPEPFDAFEPTAFAPGADPAATSAALDGLVAWLATQSKTRSGIWRDIAVRHRKTEVPLHYGPVVEAGQSLGVPTPGIRALVTEIVAVEDGAPMDEDRIRGLVAAVGAGR